MGRRCCRWHYCRWRPLSLCDNPNDADPPGVASSHTQTAAGDSEVFIFSEPRGCTALQGLCEGVVEFDCNEENQLCMRNCC